MNFTFDGTFWKWDDTLCNGLPTSAVVSSLSVPPPSQSVFAVTHTGAVHEFLLLHFRMGHLNYNAMLRALHAGSWSGFRHSLKHIYLEQLPKCPVRLRMKNKHKPVPIHKLT